MTDDATSESDHGAEKSAIPTLPVNLSGKSWAGVSGLLAAAIYFHTQFVVPQLATIAEGEAEAAVEDYDKMHNARPHAGAVSEEQFEASMERLMDRIAPLATQTSVDMLQNDISHVRADVDELKDDVDDLNARGN